MGCFGPAKLGMWEVGWRMRDNQSQLSAAFDIQYDPKHCCISFSHRIRFGKIIAHLMQEFAEGSF
jgi:hypothetical protein